MSHKHHRNVRWTTRTVYFYSAQKQLRFAALWSSFAPPFSDPAKASDKRIVKIFRRQALRELKKIKTACADLNYTTEEAQIVIGQWRQQYNTVRPHSALGYRPPAPGAYSPVWMPVSQPRTVI